MNPFPAEKSHSKKNIQYDAITLLLIHKSLNCFIFVKRFCYINNFNDYETLYTILYF